MQPCCRCYRRPLRPLLTLLVLVYLVFVVLQLTGCASSLMSTSLMSQDPRSVRGSLAPRTPQDAYAKVVQTATQFGIHIQSNDPQTRTLSGVKHKIVQMNIAVDMTSMVNITCTLMPGQIAYGPMNECDQYLHLLTGDRADAR
jgi:hypothetical protein